MRPALCSSRVLHDVSAVPFGRFARQVCPVPGVPAECPKGCLQVALGIDQEIAADDDPFTVRDASQDLHVRVAPPPELDLARLEDTATEIHEHHLTRAGIEDRRLRNRDLGADTTRLDLDSAV